MKAVLLILIFVAYGKAEASCMTVRTQSGLVCGVRQHAITGDPFVSFLGIPYAKPPLGELRYAEPQEPPPFIGVFNATVSGPICPQNATNYIEPFMRPTSVSEDCLRINVHVPLPKVDPDTIGPRPLLPVLAFVHGGSFADGSGDPDMYGPEYLMSKGVIVVTFNYRINSMGFLSLQSKSIPGNAGLRDVLFALKWIQKNIQNFGGDPDQVTLGGVSSGACVAHLVAISPATKGLGLFKRLILMSGSAIGNIFSPNPLKAKLSSKLFLEAMGISRRQSPEKIHQEIIKAPIGKILEANQFVKNHTDGVYFGPVIEIPYDGFTTIIPKDPEHLIREGYGKEYPTLLGFTDSEMVTYRHRFERALPKIKKHPFLMVPQNLLLSSNILTVPVLTRKISDEYFNGSIPTIDQIDAFIRFCTDSFFKYTAMRIADIRLEVGAAPSFIYEFGYRAPIVHPLKRILGFDWTGIAHAEDLVYVFRLNSEFPKSEVDELAQDDDMSHIQRFMTDSIANFVKFGHPGEELADWSPSGVDSKFMSIVAPKPKFQPATPYMIRMKKFFDELYNIGRLEFLADFRK